MGIKGGPFISEIFVAPCIRAQIGSHKMMDELKQKLWTNMRKCIVGDELGTNWGSFGCWASKLICSNIHLCMQRRKFLRDLKGSQAGSNRSLLNCKPATLSVAVAFFKDTFPTSHLDDCCVREKERPEKQMWAGLCNGCILMFILSSHRYHSNHTILTYHI